MTENLPAPVAPSAPSDPAEAFEALRRELSLTRLAVEGLTAARDRVPDYSPTLGEMNGRIERIATYAKFLGQQPGLQATAESLAQDINTASQTIRAQDRTIITDAHASLQQAVGRIDGIVQRGQAADQQRKRLVQAAGAGLAVGIFLWSLLPGAMARVLPESWHVPEWMAARTMNMSMKDAGQRLWDVAHEG